MWKVYTKSGDKGYTSIASNERVSKDSSLIELQGGIDEINSCIGYLRSLLQPEKEFHNINIDLKDIQTLLFLIGSDISFKFQRSSIVDSHITDIENKIDFFLESSPKLNGFVHCSGVSYSTYSHIIRSVIRRVEISFIKSLKDMNISSYPLSYNYINRLSDYFFSLARYVNYKSGFAEEPIIF